MFFRCCKASCSEPDTFALLSQHPNGTAIVARLRFPRRVTRSKTSSSSRSLVCPGVTDILQDKSDILDIQIECAVDVHPKPASPFLSG
jgi:hypothetical protein